MRAAELGAFLRSRRMRVSPSEAGFAAGGRRRTPGLRREEVAASAGVAVSWLARLEQGRAHSVSADVLEALAGALRLDDVERDHLFHLAGLRADRRPPPPPQVTPALRRLLDDLEPNPAYVLDRGWTIIAWNTAEAALFPLVGEGRANLLDIVFEDADLRRLMVDSDEEQRRLVAQFRHHAAEWDGDPAVAATIHRLGRASARFAELWAAEDVATFATTRRLFDHPKAGRLEFDHHRFAALDQPGAQLVVYTPADAGGPDPDSAARLAAATRPS